MTLWSIARARTIDGSFFTDSLGKLRNGCRVKRLVAIEAELIRVQPAAASTLRRRLLVERSGEGVDRIPVRVTELAHEGCSIVGPRNLAEVDGRLCLKLPGLDAFQIAAIDEAEGHLLCLFAQPLSSIVFAALTGPTAPQARHRSFRARCSFLN